MRSGTLFFVEPFRLEIRETELPNPTEGQVMIQTEVSAISAGTESLFFTGNQAPAMCLDPNITALRGSSGYPLSYGYSLAGRIIATGPGVDPGLAGRKAFAFHPHATHALVRLEDTMVLPEDLDLSDAVFFPTMETAVNLVMDGAPLIGERVAVLGLGVVGLLTTALLSRFPLGSLYGIDTSGSRRRAAREHGASSCFRDADEARRDYGPEGIDLIYELTGNPAALDSALSLCGFASRVCVGSWYGSRTHPVTLGGDFHRNRVRLFSSQVSTVAPELSGRWTKARRAAIAWDETARLQPSRLISHRFPLESCAEAYTLIHKSPEDLLQVVFTY
jgi:2-desacetyl-2-hydroxyethyl bacteriochlorophyllide A dehydrogenase